MICVVYWFSNLYTAVDTPVEAACVTLGRYVSYASQHF